MKKRINPALVPNLEMFPELDLRQEYLPAIREGSDQMRPPAPVDESISVSDEVIAGADGNRLQLRIYLPKSTKEA